MRVNGSGQLPASEPVSMVRRMIFLSRGCVCITPVFLRDSCISLSNYRRGFSLVTHVKGHTDSDDHIAKGATPIPNLEKGFGSNV